MLFSKKKKKKQPYYYRTNSEIPFDRDAKCNRFENRKFNGRSSHFFVSLIIFT